MKLPRILKDCNLYELLEIDPFSDLDEIKRGYRQTALKYHPDRYPGNSRSAYRFVLCTEAYRILGDQDKRTAYDRSIGKLVPYKSRFKCSELVGQRKKTSKRFYSQRAMIDHDFNRFVDECRANFAEFLKDPGKVKARPKVYSHNSMEPEELESLVEAGRNGFQDYLKSLPRIRSRKF